MPQQVALPQQIAAGVGIPILSAVAATKSVLLAGIHLALGVNVVVMLASVVLAWLRLHPVRRAPHGGGRRCSVEAATATEWNGLYELAV